LPTFAGCCRSPARHRRPRWRQPRGQDWPKALSLACGPCHPSVVTAE
jgi:hypothetical protein